MAAGCAFLLPRWWASVPALGLILSAWWWGTRRRAEEGMEHYVRGMLKSDPDLSPGAAAAEMHRHLFKNMMYHTGIPQAVCMPLRLAMLVHPSSWRSAEECDLLDRKRFRKQITRRLHAGKDPNLPYNSWLPLSLAVFYRMPDVVEALLEAGADPNAKNELDKSAMSSALQWPNTQEDVDCVRLLIEHGAKADDALFEVCRWPTEGHGGPLRPFRIPLVALLVRHGADVNEQGEDGCVPLHACAWAGNAPLAEWLLNHGADPNVRSKQGQTPLDCAEEGSYYGGPNESHAAVAAVLLSRGARSSTKRG